MQTVTVSWFRAFAAMLVFASGCVPANEDSSGMDCSTLSTTIFRKPVNVQIAEFSRLDVKRKYEVFICGNQVMEPPTIHLASPFAKEGKAATEFLKARLSMVTGDLTIRDILLVFEEMSRQETYNVAGDSDLMNIVNKAVGRVKDPHWKYACEQSLRVIQRRP